jgi:hypothetical protein
MNEHDRIIERLENHRTKAPEGFSNRVMEALPAWQAARRRGEWSRRRPWLMPALAGAAAMGVVMLGILILQPEPVVPATAQSGMVTLRFELFAPGADQVELLGTFNNWKTGDIELEMAEDTGQWTATVALPEGRHEYIFLVDGERWIADPKATTFRPDGFGNVNTVIQVYDEDNV